MFFCIQTALKSKKYIYGIGCTGKKTRLESVLGDRWICKAHVKNETSVEAVCCLGYALSWQGLEVGADVSQAELSESQEGTEVHSLVVF